MSSRLERLLARARTREGGFWQRNQWAAEAVAQTDGQPSVLRQAHVLRHILQEAPAVIGAEELLAGTQPVAPWPDLAPAGPHLLPDPDLYRSEAQRRAMRAGVFTSGIKTGHLTPDYPRLLAEGLGGVLCRVKAHPRTGGEAQVEREAMETTLQAASEFIRRHAALADCEATACEEPTRREELAAIARACWQVSTDPPRTLHEALQLLWFTYLLQCLEEGASTAAFALGRFDQYLYPFWASDLAAGRPREELRELVGCFWVKLNEFAGLQVLNLTLAGSDADGRDCVNDLSYACLELMAQLRTPVPSLSVRWHAGLAPGFFRQAVELSALGLGQPAFYGDPAARQAMEAAGVAARDAADVVPGGCVELGVQGCCNPWVGNFFNLPKCLE
ncbi:MAG: pyruvate formate lyase family protein, partial [Armatimonadota bacterium]